MMNPTRHEDTSPSSVNDYLSEERPKRYSSNDLKSFTSDFSESNSIGYGGFAEVYKGMFPCGELRAVKVLNKGGFEEDTFRAEVRTMGKTAHRNLVKFYGYCFEDNMKALVYEYMENGSLDKILYENHHGNIEWVKLYAIVIDVANGLQYLHHGLVEQIIHHDIKAANVLLDKKFSAKITDFGLARIMKRDVSRVDLSRYRGTPGYNAPETWMPQSQVTFKCDVYSFGMMLFEVVGKRKNGKEEKWFPRSVWNQFENGNLENFLKDCGIAEKDKENANILCKVALWCVQDNPDKRPSMKDVVLMLEKEKLVEDPPCPSDEFRQFSQMIDMGESGRENIGRERSDKMELDSSYPQNITANESIAGSDGGVALPQLKSNKRKTQSPNMFTKHVDYLEEEQLKIEIVAEKRHHTQVQELPENFTVGLDHVLERAVNLLGKDDVQVLGLYGVGGVGKTTLLKKINNELPKRNNDFDIVIWVVISREVNMGTVQEAIRERLGLMPRPENVSSISRTSDIFNALKMKKFLILLDDVWKEIDLQSIGIPLPSVKNMSKIVLTTRSLDVCHAMEADNTIEVKCLNQEQSWVLFQKKVGQQTLNVDPEIPMLAKEVARKCHGLPIVLITVGSSMASKTNPREWKSGILDLNKSAAKFPDMEERVFHLLKFSYDKLPSLTHQVCFLFCALYPEDRSISLRDLIHEWIGAGYISGFEDYEEALNKVHNIIGTLQRTCLLEKGWDTDNSVKMHDVIREFALWIACDCGQEEGKVFVKSGHALTEIPWTHLRPTVVQKISLTQTNISHLQNLPSCPNLSIFFAIENPCLNHIIDNFFFSTPALKFLDLSFSGITKVPTSICELFELGYLDLSYTKITSLPYGMRNLTKLKYLSFTETELLRIIPRGMMRNFSNLEILALQVPILSGDFDEEMHGNIINELQCLKQLKYLDITISDFKDLEKFVRDPRLCNCTWGLRVQMCKQITLRLSLGHFKQLRYLEIRNCSKLQELFFDWITNNDEKEVRLFENLEKMWLENLPKLVISWDVRNLQCAHFRKLHYVFLKECDAMVDITWLLLIPNLQTLHIVNCGSLEEILSSSEENSFSKLKTLVLQDLPNLRTICSISTLPFPSLETIHVRRCPKLRRLPLDLNSANNTFKEILGEVDWWNGLQWENETIKARFVQMFL